MTRFNTHLFTALILLLSVLPSAVKGQRQLPSLQSKKAVRFTSAKKAGANVASKTAYAWVTRDRGNLPLGIVSFDISKPQTLKSLFSLADKAFAGTYGPKALKDRPLFEEFYAVDFQKAKAICGFTEEAEKTVSLLKAAGVRVILATNPIFPAVATESRIRWAGLSPEDFELYTTYENSSFCKPNPAYYGEILQRLDLRGEDCLMVGNDVREDMAAEMLGMETFLLTDCLINTENVPLDRWPHGGFQDLQAHLKERLKLNEE